MVERVESKRNVQQNTTQTTSRGTEADHDTNRTQV